MVPSGAAAKDPMLSRPWPGIDSQAGKQSNQWGVTVYCRFQAWIKPVIKTLAREAAAQWLRSWTADRKVVSLNPRTTKLLLLGPCARLWTLSCISEINVCRSAWGEPKDSLSLSKTHTFLRILKRHAPQKQFIQRTSFTFTIPGTLETLHSCNCIQCTRGSLGQYVRFCVQETS